MSPSKPPPASLATEALIFHLLDGDCQIMSAIDQAPAIAITRATDLASMMIPVPVGGLTQSLRTRVASVRPVSCAA